MRPSEVFVHPTSAVHPHAQLGEGVWIGPHCVIGEKAVIHGRTRLEGNIQILGFVEIGESCLFSPFSVIGGEPQDVAYRQEETKVRIGDRNVFREFITVHRGTVKGGGLTSIGDDNYIMAYSHIAHDCRVGSFVVLTNGSTLGGHCTVDDHTTLSAFVGVHQFCRIGKSAYIGGYTVVTHDVVPFAKVAGMRPVLFYGLNAIGLRRRGFSRERIQTIKEIFKILFYSDLNTQQAIEQIQARIPEGEDRDEIIRFIQASKRGIIKKPSGTWDDESE
ncbi:MAG: acyl-ACP--UDP-N-acetylglucosamine O-acyltransferase [Candidatus Aminicenantales bacterium]